MNLKEIKDMINLMNENDLAELEMERDGLKIRLRKNSSQIQQEVIAAGSGKAGQAQAAGEEERASMQPGLIEIKSPMVGTFYRTPSPDSAPFVEEGSEVQPGGVICIIEAMKLMNEIKAEVKGRIREILVENGHPVEFGQVLFKVEPL